MDGAPSKQTTTGGGGGGPAPFLLKTYDMVDDSITDEIVSWSSTRNSFVVWNPPEFARLLLPTYFKHNNFSSFIRQLNTYGFRKIDPERWEFANEDFVKNQKELLKNIHRRKPIHSHSNPQGSTIDSERAAFEEEIDKLTLEKTALENSLSRFKQKQPVAKLQIEDLTQRVDSMEQRQDNLLTFLEKAVQNPGFVDILSQKLESMDFSAYNKKRRLPSDDKSQMVPDDGFVDNQDAYRPEFGNVFHHDFANKLNLELSSAVSDNNLVSNSTQSSNEDGGSPQIRFSESYVKDPQMTPTGIPFATEQLELTDTGTSFTFNMDSSFVDKMRPCEEAEGNLSCLLNLSLASSVSQVNASQSTDKMSRTVEEIGKNEVADFRVPEKNGKPSRGPPSNNQVAATVRAPVNDVFWEQFLTEKPGSSGAEEASSNFKEDQSTSHVPNGNLQNLNL